MAKLQSVEISTLFHTCVHLTQSFWFKRFAENFSSFPGKFTLCTNLAHNMSLVGCLKSHTVAMWQSMEVSVLFHTCVYQILPFWLKRSFENSSSVPGNFTSCAKLAKNEFVEILKSYSLTRCQSIEISVLFHSCTH